MSEGKRAACKEEEDCREIKKTQGKKGGRLKRKRDRALCKREREREVERNKDVGERE